VDPQLREELKRLSLVVITGTTMLHKPVASPPPPPPPLPLPLPQLLPPSPQQGIHSSDHQREHYVSYFSYR
jgi:hypothetical protein